MALQDQHLASLLIVIEAKDKYRLPLVTVRKSVAELSNSKESPRGIRERLL